jgi:hypothetical protein
MTKEKLFKQDINSYKPVNQSHSYIVPTHSDVDSILLAIGIGANVLYSLSRKN